MTEDTDRLFSDVSLIMEDCLFEEVLMLLYHQGLMVKKFSINEVAVYEMIKDEHSVQELGVINVFSDQVVILTTNESRVLKVSDPRFFHNLLNFFGVTDEFVDIYFDRKASDRALQKLVPTTSVPAQAVGS